MKFLILGCNGMAGHTIALYLSERGHEVIGFAKEKSNFIDSICGDALDTSSLSEIILNGHFDSVINCIGILNQFAEENKSLAVFLNSYLPHFLADITAKTNTQIIHMSTDCVFSGKKGGYTELDLRDGETFYDRSKALGELDNSKDITLRNSIIGPDINESGIGLFNWFMKSTTENGKSVNGYTGAMWTGQTTLQLAKTMEIVAKNRSSGLYNAVPNYSISKYELLKLFNKYFRQDSVEIIPVEGVNIDKSLKSIKSDFDCQIPDYDVMISEMADWIKKHNKLYPHYMIK